MSEPDTQFDPSKLSPAPWVVRVDPELDWSCIPKPNGYPLLMGEDESEDCRAALAFAALARNAEDVMLRRDWHAKRIGDGCWLALTGHDRPITDEWLAQDESRIPSRRFWPHPFVALVEADEWYKANVEAAQSVAPAQTNRI
jgi:hypothetical protein